MSPNDQIHQPRIITKSRIIAGFLNEMDAAGALILLSNENGEFLGSIRISCEFKVPFETSIIEILDKDLPLATYSATALFAGQRIQFKLEVASAHGNCRFPDQLTLVDLRAHKRRRFGPEVQSAEIATHKGVLMAMPIDLSQNSLAVVLATNTHELSINERVKVKVRGGNTSRDVFSFDMKVNEIDATNSIVRVLLNFEGKTQNSGVRRSGRRLIGGVKINIRPVDDHIGGEQSCPLNDVSLTGCQCEVDSIEQAPWLAPGVHVFLHTSNVSATIMWIDGKRFGLRLDALDDSNTLSNWYEMLGQIRPHNSVHHSQFDELVGLFTQSGLLKGSRRKIFGKNPTKFLPPDLVATNPMLFHRVASTSQDGRIVGQYGLIRMTDDFWCMQEGAHMGEAGASYRDLFRDVHRIARELYHSSTLAPRYVGCLWQDSLKSTAEYANEFLQDPANYKFSMIHFILSAQDRKVGFKAECAVVNLQSIDARQRLDINCRFNPVLFEIFSGWNGSHPRLNAELSKLGPHHYATTVALYSNDKCWGLAYRLNSYYAMSATGVVNSLFLVVRSDTSAEELHDGLRELKKSGFTFGTDDAAVIIDNSEACAPNFTDTLKNSRSFNFFVIDSQMNKELLGDLKEPDRPEMLRKQRE